MQHRKVKIVKVEWLYGIDIGKREDSPVKPIIKIGYSPIGMSYPMSLKECKECIDQLIVDVMRCVGVPEPDAIKLINNT
jgi:hypothetical protein